MILGLEVVIGVLALVIVWRLLRWLLVGWWKRRPRPAQPPLRPMHPDKFDGFEVPAQPWTVADLVDFEYLLRSDRQVAGAAALDRDQAIYRALEERAPKCLADRAYLLRCWLGCRRHLGAGYLGGKDVVRAWKLLVTAAVVASFCIGLVHAGSVLLLLDQGRHVSAPKAVLATVGIQLLMSMLVLCLWLVRRSVKAWYGEFSSLRVALVRAILPVLSGRRNRGRFAHCVEQVADAEHSNGPIVFGHIFMAAQLCVAAMSLGLLASLNLYHYFSEDLRFGWSTTHRVTAEGLHKVTGLVSTPWSALTDLGQPTLAQVEASRLTRDSPEYTVPAAASGAWTAFISFSIITYGLLMRLVFACVAALRADRLIKRPDFSGPLVDELLRRMRRAEGPLPRE